MDDIKADYWAHYYFANPNGEEVEDDDFDLDAVVASMADDDWEDVIQNG